MKISKLFLLFIILFSLSIVKSDVFINEIYTKNKNKKNLKASYSSPEWIEESSKNKEIYANFKLDKKGDKLFFSDKKGSLIEQIEIPSLKEDSIYRRNEQGKFEIMSGAPLKDNQNEIPPPEFSEDSGFFPNEFDLTLTSSLEGATIYYTVDGSNPIDSETREEYKGKSIKIYDRTEEPNIYAEYEEDESSPISISRGTGFKKPNYPIDKGMVVRAVAIKDDSQSKVVDKTYFVTTGNLAEYQDYFIISLVTNPANLFDPEIGIYVTGKQYIDWITSPGYVPNPDKWSKTNICNYYSRGKDWEREASVAFFDKGKLVLEQNIGIRLKGSSTRNSPQKSFDLIADKQYGKEYFEYKFFEENYDLEGKVIDKYGSITIRGIYGDERLRDRFGRDIIHERKSVTTSWMKHCILFLNGEYWGMYELMEKVIPLFFQQHYGIPEEKLVVLKENEVEEGPQEECDKYLQIDEQFSLNDLSNDNNYKEVEQYFDLDSFAEHYAIGIYLGTWDWPLQNQGMWKYFGDKIEGNKFTDGRWRFMTYDLDFSMGLTFENYGGVEGYQYNNFRHIQNRRGNKPPTNLFLALLKNNEFKRKFINLICDYSNDILNIDRIKLIINEYKETVTWMFAYGKYRWWNDGKYSKLEGYSLNKNNFENVQLKYLETFFTQRGKNILPQMKEFLNINGDIVELTIKKEGEGKIRINNSIEPIFKDGKWTGKYFKGIQIYIAAIPENDKQFKGWTGDYESENLKFDLNMKDSMTLTANF